MSYKLIEKGPNVFEIPITESQGMNVPGRIFTSEKMLKTLTEDKSLEQVINVAKLPGIIEASIAMPDIHWGYGFPIGGVAAFDYEEGIVSPGGVGYDINCGVTLINTGMSLDQVNPKKKALLDKIFSMVPSGMNKSRDIKLNSAQISEVLQSGIKWAIDNGYANKKDMQKTEENGSSEMADSSKVSQDAISRGQSQLGTIGSGNHFLEIQKVDTIFDSDISGSFGIKGSNDVMVMIHTGSRGLGHQVATDYIKKINDQRRKTPFIEDKQLNFAETTSKIGEEYIGAMFAAANFGFVNRAVIVHRIREAFKFIFKEECDIENMVTVYSLAHNIAKIEEHTIDGRRRKLIVHRKGATRAFSGKYVEDSKFSKFGHPVLIPGDMGSASYVMAGKSENMKLSFGSTCHGAGRKFSRKRSMETFGSEDVKANMEKNGIYLRTLSNSTIAEESPGSYKDIDEVISAVIGANLALPVARNIPIAVMKG
ncbi:MAG: RtcB family protein [Thermoplasmataceae archaeon]